MGVSLRKFDLSQSENKSAKQGRGRSENLDGQWCLGPSKYFSGPRELRAITGLYLYHFWKELVAASVWSQISAEFDNPRIAVRARGAGGSNRVDYPFSDSLGRDGCTTKDSAHRLQMDIARLIP